MRQHKITVAVVVLAAVLFSLAPSASAGGNTVFADCIAVDKTGTATVPSGGAEMSGTVAIVANGGVVGTNLLEVDVLLSLKFRNQEAIVSGTIDSVSVLNLPTEQESVICGILDALNGAILHAFDITPPKQLKICFSNPASSTTKFNCQSLTNFQFDGQFGLGVLNRIFVVD